MALSPSAEQVDAGAADGGGARDGSALDAGTEAGGSGSSADFWGDFEEGHVALRGWFEVDSVAAAGLEERVQLVSDVVRQGRYAVRIQVQAGDNAGGGAQAARLRGMAGPSAELLAPNEAKGGTFYYAFSVRLGAPWVPPAQEGGYRWGIVAALESSYAFSPAFVIGVDDAFRVVLNGGDKSSTGNVNTDYPLSDATVRTERWSDFVLRIDWQPTATGSVQVWRRDEGEQAFRAVLEVRDVATLIHKQEPGGPLPHRWYFGYNRSDSSHVSVLWLDAFCRARSFDDVVECAFGAGARDYVIPPLEAEVSGFSLIDLDTDQTIGPLTDGATLTLGTLPARFSVRADVRPILVPSVRFRLDGNAEQALDTRYPYMLTASGPGAPAAWSPAPGVHDVSATAYTSGYGNGSGRSASLRVTIAP